MGTILSTVLGSLGRARDTVLGNLTTNPNAMDVLGGTWDDDGTVYLGASVPIFTDKLTVEYVQKALAALPAAQVDPVFRIKADGVKGKDTNAALLKFNSQFRGEPGDGDNITEGTLTALKLSPGDAPSGYLETAYTTSVAPQPDVPAVKKPTLTLVPSTPVAAVPSLPAPPAPPASPAPDASQRPLEIALAAGAVGLVGLGLYLALR